MSKIEKHLHEHFASLMENADDTEIPALPTSVDPSPRDYVPEVLDDPFAKVNTVASGSPAATAGLQPGDLIRNFGWVNQGNHDGLTKVAECVQGNEGVSWSRLPLDRVWLRTRLTDRCFCSGLSSSRFRGSVPRLPRESFS